MSTLSDYRNERLRKLSELKELGFEAYPTKSSRTQTVGEVLDMFEDKLNSEVVVAGRITSIRKMGKLAFIVLKDMSGSMQLFIREGDINPTSVGAGIESGLDAEAVVAGDKGASNRSDEINIGLEHINLLDWREVSFR
jgi:lysyl-tRNA synthetase, class II